MVKALELSSTSPGLDSQTCIMWVVFTVASRLCLERVLLQALQFGTISRRHKKNARAVNCPQAVGGRGAMNCKVVLGPLGCQGFDGGRGPPLSKTPILFITTATTYNSRYDPNPPRPLSQL